MKTRKTIFWLIFLSFFRIIIPAQAAAFETLHEAIAETSANVVFMRHALAPGFGDPAAFQINKCSTQRNLDEAGRQQAKTIGKYLRENKIEFDAILSSQWCRCKHTAALLNIGNWTEFRGLNSFYQDHADRIDTLKRLQQ